MVRVASPKQTAGQDQRADVRKRRALVSLGGLEFLQRPVNAVRYLCGKQIATAVASGDHVRTERGGAQFAGRLHARIVADDCSESIRRRMKLSIRFTGRLQARVGLFLD